MTDTAKLFGNKVRLRVCGLLFKDDSILLAKHQGIGNPGPFWLPPGGGVEFGEDARSCLVREMKEETGLDIIPGGLQFTYQFIRAPYHAVELFFRIDEWSGELKTGIDPELPDDQQIIEEVRFVTFSEIGVMQEENVHGVFRFCRPVSQIIDLRGFYSGT